METIPAFVDDQKEYYDSRLHQITLREHAFKNIRFEECEFENCDFSDSILERCQFVDCRFLGCNLGNINLSYSRFTDVVFEGCKAIGIDWTRADWPQFISGSPISFLKSVINDSTFFGLNLEGLAIEECKAHDVDFRDADLTGANFSYSDLSNSLFRQTKLTNADFTEAINYFIDIYQNDIKGARFSRLEAIRLLDCLGIDLVD